MDTAQLRTFLVGISGDAFVSAVGGAARSPLMKERTAAIARALPINMKAQRIPATKAPATIGETASRLGSAP